MIVSLEERTSAVQMHAFVVELEQREIEAWILRIYARRCGIRSVQLETAAHIFHRSEQTDSDICAHCTALRGH